MRVAWCLSAVLALCVGCAGDDAQRIVLITLDTLRYDRAVDVKVMPGLSAWARTGTSFERCYAASPVTQPTHATLFTARHPWEHGITRNGIAFVGAHVTLAEQLKNAGFATSAVVSSVPVSRRFGYAQGFDVFDQDFDTGHGGKTWPRLAENEDGAHFYALAASTTERAFAALDAIQGRKQFLWFHYFDPHDPYGDSLDGETLDPRQVLTEPAATRDAAATRARRLYDADVAFLDGRLATLLARLGEDAKTLPTHVVLTADHGESLGEDGSFGHGRRLTEGPLRVPCVVHSPRLAPGTRDDVTGSIDLAATLFALAGLATESGRDLTQAPDPSAQAFGMRRTFEGPTLDRRMDGSRPPIADPFFFAVAADGTVTRGTAEKSPGFAAFARTLSGVHSEPVQDPEALEQLRALGYVD